MKKCELSWEFKQQLKKSISEFEEKLKMPPTSDELSWEFKQQFEEKKSDKTDLRRKIVSLEFKQQLKKSMSEFEEKLKTPPIRDDLSWGFEQHVIKKSDAEFEEELKKDRADLEDIIQSVKSEAEDLIKEIDRQDSILKKWWMKWQKRGQRHKELAQVMQVIQQQAEQELMKKVMQHQAEQELMGKAMQQQAEQELGKLNLPPKSPHNYC